MIIQATVAHSDLKIYKNIAKQPFAIFSHAYQHNHWCYGLESFARYYATIKQLTAWKICESDQNWQNSEQSFEYVAVICINSKLSLTIVFHF